MRRHSSWVFNLLDPLAIQLIAIGGAGFVGLLLSTQSEGAKTQVEKALAAGF
jgi:hypothetical protein